MLEGILNARPDAVVSVDTYKAATARAALAAGAEIVNDVSGFTWDPEMPRPAPTVQAGVVLTHTRGRPEEWRTQPQLAPDAARFPGARRPGREPCASPRLRGSAAIDRPRSRLWIRQTLWRELCPAGPAGSNCLSLGRPLLAGISRKSFLGHTLAPLYGGSPAPVDARETASVAAMVAAILNGASIVRVHTVRPAVEAARIADAVLAAGCALVFSATSRPECDRMRQGNRFDQADILPFAA